MPIKIQVGRQQGTGNQMFRYAYAKALQAMVPGAEVVGHHLPMFGLQADTEPLDGRVLHMAHGHRHPLSTVSSLLKRRVYDHVQLDGFVQRMEFYPDRDLVANLFPALTQVDTRHVTDRHLLINVRGAEILGNVHPDYGPVPVAYFQKIADASGLEPVVMGQLGDDFYSDHIRRSFQGCTFLSSVSPAHDFETMRNAVHVVTAVSTFSWLACWMSRTTQTIHMPLKGLFNPLQRPDVDLLPLGDPRYRLHHFPVERWTASEEQKQRLVAPDAPFMTLTQAQARQLLSYTAS